MSDIDLSLARLAADAEQKRAALEVENDTLRTELDLVTEERDAALYRVDELLERLA